MQTEVLCLSNIHERTAHCLVPKEIDGLLLSGRNISGTHMAHSNFRAMPICMGIGEAAGITAAISVIQDKKVRDVNVKDIQKLF